LGFLHPPSSGSGEFPALAWSGIRRSGWFGVATGQHGSEFGNFSVDLELLLFKTKYGGLDDFGSQFVRGHIN
jgi:hypothetical protein